MFTTALAMGLLSYVSLNPQGQQVIAVFGGTTTLLLLAVFAVVNRLGAGAAARHDRHQPLQRRTGLPFVGAVACVYFVLPWSSGRPAAQYQIAGVLLATGVVLWAITWIANRALYAKRTFVHDPSDLAG